MPERSAPVPVGPVPVGALPAGTAVGPGTARARTTASAIAGRASRICLFSRVGWTRLVSRMTNSSRAGSIQIEVPVKPVWPKEAAEKKAPAEE